MKNDYKTIKPMKGIPDQLRKLRRQFLRYQQAEIVYSLSHKKLLELASDAGAIYRFDSTVLINREIFDAYLERFHGTRTNCRLPHQKICRRTNTLPAEKYHWGNQEPSFKRNAVLLYPRGEKSGHGANQRRFPPVRFAKAAAAAGRNRTA